jgi:tripartite-type tricarboxylate transporter receptor subunit TctC
MDRRQFISSAAWLGASALVAGSGRAMAQAYPSKPVTILCPFAAGGGGDALTRVLADHVRSKRSVAAAVEYRPGAGATIAPGQIARAAPDGTTLALYSISPFIVVPHLQRLPYDPLKDFTYIGIYAYIPIAFYVKTDNALKDWAGVIKYAKDNPGKFRWGTSGVRGAAHIAVEAAFRKEGIQTTFVPFTGGSEAITALLGGHIEAVISADYGPQLSAGTVRLLALTGTEKLAGQPSLPTFKDLGYPLSTEALYGLIGPAKLPTEIVSYWDGAIKEMMKTDEFATALKAISASPVYMNSADFTANVAENYRKIGEAMETLGFKKS